MSRRKSLVRPVALIAACLWAASLSPASADNAMPDGRALIVAGLSALHSANTQYFTAIDVVTVTGVQQNVAIERGAASFRPLQVDAVQSATSLDITEDPPRRQTLRPIHVLLSGDQGALRKGNQAWSCTSADAASQNVVEPSDFMAALDAADVQTIGPEMLDGTSVWHVRIKKMVRYGHFPLQVNLDVFLRRSDLLPLHATAQAALMIPGQTMQEEISLDVSNFGKNVSVSLPVDCRSGSTGRAHATSLGSVAAFTHGLTRFLSARAAVTVTGRTHS